MYMQQVHQTHAGYSDDDEDDNYRAIKNMTIHYQTHNDPEHDHAEEQWNAQNDNQENEFQDDIKYQIIQNGNIGKINDGTGSAETMVNKYQGSITPSNTSFHPIHPQTNQQNGNNILSTKGNINMGSSMIAGGNSSQIDQNGNNLNQIQNSQKIVQQSQSLQGNKQGFKIINKEKSNLLSSSSILFPKSLTNIDSQQIGGGNSNSQFLNQQQQISGNNGEFRNNSQINDNNLMNSINNGISLNNSGLLLQSINNGLAQRNHAQSINFQENSSFLGLGKGGFKSNQNYLDNSLIQHNADQINQEQNQFQQQNQQFQSQQQKFQSQVQQFQQQEKEQVLLQQDNHVLNKVKSEDCSSTNEQPNIINNLSNNSCNITKSNNFGTINSGGSASQTLSHNQAISPPQQTINPPNQVITPPHQSSLHNSSGHISNKQMKGSNASTVEIKKKKLEVVQFQNNQNQIGQQIYGQQQHIQQQQQFLNTTPQQPPHHPSQFQPNFMNQIPNKLNYSQNPNQHPPPSQQQVGYGYPYSQQPQSQPQQYGQQPAAKNFLPPHYAANPHLAQYNSYIDQTNAHQQNLLAQAALQNHYSQEIYDGMSYGSLLPPHTSAPQPPVPPPNPQNPGYGDYLQQNFNGIQYNAYNQGYSQHAPGQAHQNAVAAAVAAYNKNQQQNLQFLQHVPQSTQPNGFNQGFPLNLHQGAANLANCNHDASTQSSYGNPQNQQAVQIPAFKIKEEAQQKNGDDKNSTSSSQNNINYPNGNVLQQQGLNNSNQLNQVMNGQSQTQSNIQNSYNMLNGSNQYPQIMLPKQGQQLIQYPDSIGGQGIDQHLQSNNTLKITQQNQSFLGGQLNQFNAQQQQQQQQQQFLKQQQNQFIQQQQHMKQQQQNNIMANNNLEEQSRDAEEDEEDNANSDGNAGEGNANGKTKRPKNETKNIPKNYAKAFLRYIIDKERVDEMKKILKSIDTNLEYDDIKKEAKTFKKNMNAIKDVRKIWQNDTNDRTRSISKFMRIASHQFLQKEAISYIFSSNKIKNSKSHIIYRHVMGLAMADPEKFNNIKSLYKNAYQD